MMFSWLGLGVTTEARADVVGKVTIGSFTCSLQVENPHRSSHTGGKTVGGRTQAKCNYSNITMVQQGQLQKCTHMSYGCLWSTVRGPLTKEHYPSPTSYWTQKVYKDPCKNGHYRLGGKITIYKNGTSKSTGWKYKSASVSC